MRTISSVAELRSALALLRKQEKQIGFIPTMGALHEGHLSLIRLSKKQADVTVVSIFVNPTQFGPNEDFSRYPRTIENDISLLVTDDVDLLFLPTAEDMYPQGHSSMIHIGKLGEVFEGAIRPGHFDGVATVVMSLFNIVQPHIAFFGQKDAQQVAVIKQIVRDFHVPVEIVVGPTIREMDGLALSSRNRYLSESDRSASSALSLSLAITQDELLGGTPVEIAKQKGLSAFNEHAPSAHLDYLELVDSETFVPISSFSAKNWNGPAPTLLIAARFANSNGETRLIDNVRIG
jgi:pantoate--beta-alanine ligase